VHELLFSLRGRFACSSALPVVVFVCYANMQLGYQSWHISVKRKTCFSANLNTASDLSLDRARFRFSQTGSGSVSVPWLAHSLLYTSIYNVFWLGLLIYMWCLL